MVCENVNRREQVIVYHGGRIGGADIPFVCDIF